MPFVLVFTKCDKLSSPQLDRNLNVYLNRLKERWENLPRHFCTSALKQTGKDEILDFIGETITKVNFR